MKVRTLIFIALVCLYSLPLVGQNGRYSSLKDFSKVKNSTLLVVVDVDDPLYSQSIKEIIDSSWTFMPYQFVDSAGLYEISKKKEDKDYSILVRNKAQRIVNRVNGTDIIQSNHLAIYLMDKGSDLRNYTGKDALTQFHFKDVKNTFEYFHKLPACIKYMQLYLQFIEEKKPTEDNHPRLLKEFNAAHTALLKDYRLYLEQSPLLEELSVESLKEVYPYEIEIVEQEKILQAVQNETEKTAFVHLDPRVKQITVMDAASGEILYLARTDVTGELNFGDFKKIARQISGVGKKKKGKLKDRLKGKFQKKS